MAFVVFLGRVDRYEESMYGILAAMNRLSKTTGSAVVNPFG
jgi:hypothetical protein